MWRPEGDWIKRRNAFFDSIAGTDKFKERCYEAGASAMLQAIWKLAKESPTGTFTFDSKEVNIFSEEIKDGRATLVR